MKRLKRGRWLLLIALPLSVVLVVFWRVLPHNGLLDRATVLIPREKWVGAERRNGDVGNYTWLTNDEILLYQRGPGKTLTLARKKVLPVGTEEPSRPLPLAPLANPMSVTLSPDHTMLHVIYPGIARRTQTRSEFVSLSDSRIQKVIGWALGSWYEGEAATCELDYNQKLSATLHHFDGRKEEEIVVNGVSDVPLMKGNVWPLFIEASGRVVAVGDSHYDGIMTPETKASLGGKLSPVRTFVECNLKEPEKKGKVWTVPVPADAASFFCQASPGHDRLLWIVQSNRMSTLSAMTQKLPAPLKRPIRYLCRWMVSDLYGHNMRTLVEFEISDLFYNRPDLVSPQWTPDGKHISFEYNSALYRLAVDE